MLFTKTTVFLLLLKVAGIRAQETRACVETGSLPELDPSTIAILSSVSHGINVVEGYNQYRSSGGETVGSNTQLLCEAADASATGATVEDGKSGDTDFPHGDLKVIATMGERSVCSESYGQKLVGVPDGMGAYLLDDNTVRVVFQSESYGPLRQESFPVPVNGGTATLGGSHIQYIDYDRATMEGFMSYEGPASDMVVGVGNMVEHAYNLKGEAVGPREDVEEGTAVVGAHFGNSDADGKYVVKATPSEVDWFLQSLCSAHMEEKHQWGEGIGLEDDIFVTNEEWIEYEEGSNFVGLSAHALDVKNKALHALGVFSNGGFEKIVEINSQHPDYVMFSISGYTGAFKGYDAELEARNAEYNRTDGKDYIWTNNIHPARIYVGVKGKMEDGSDAPEDDFLARNGLRYGKIYGYAVDMGEPFRQSKGLWRDEFHRSPEHAVNGARVKGVWIAQEWSWDGEVKNYRHDASWEYQDKPPHTGPGTGRRKLEWWTGMGPDEKGCKTEHNSPDPREGFSAFVQSSTCGYFGHYYVDNVLDELNNANGDLPDLFEGKYYVYQGELDITDQIQLGGKGQYVNGTDATMNYDKPESPHATFEDIDGFEVVEATDGELYAIIQEDSGNSYGERMFITKLEHRRNQQELTYYFVAMSGGKHNTRIVNKVSIPKGTWSRATGHEFSGVFDMSGFFAKNEDGSYIIGAADTGAAKRKADRSVAINDKLIMVNVQGHTQAGGLFAAYQLDRGGQIYLYQPELPDLQNQKEDQETVIDVLRAVP